MAKIRTWLIAAVAVTVIAAAIWYFALRDTRTSCEKLVGPLAELEELAGTKLEMRSGYESNAACYQYVEREGRAGGSVLAIDIADGDSVERWQSSLAGREKLTFTTVLGEAMLYVAGESAQHVALVHAPGRTIKIALDRELFTVDEAKRYVTSIAQRAR